MAQGNGNGKVIRLTAERFRRLERRMEAVEQAQRGTNARLDETNARLDQAIDVLTRLVRVVAAQNGRMNRNFQHLTNRIDALGARLDRFARSVMAGRTADHRRLAALGRRVDALSVGSPNASPRVTGLLGDGPRSLLPDRAHPSPPGLEGRRPLRR